MSCVEFTLVWAFKLSATTWDLPSRSFWCARQPEGWSSTQRAAHSKERALIPVWERTQPDVWCEGRKEKKKRKRKVPGNQRECRISRLTLSHWALRALSHNSSPAVISSSSFALSPLFFHGSTQVSCWRKLSRNSPGPRTIGSARQKRRIFPELPPPPSGPVLNQLWGRRV